MKKFAILSLPGMPSSSISDLKVDQPRFGGTVPAGCCLVAVVLVLVLLVEGALLLLASWEESPKD